MCGGGSERTGSGTEEAMSDRLDQFRQFMTHQVEGRLDDALAMLADDVVMIEPMTGTTTGKANVEAVMRGRPPGGDSGITWSDPALDGDTVKIVGTGAPFPVLVLVSFDAADRITKIDIGIA
jgi:hypothetical protein